jgi:pullulanase
MSSDLLARKTTHFMLWRPRQTTPPPQLVIGRLQPGNPPTFVDQHRFPLQPSPSRPDLWEIPADQCGLIQGQVYHYFFEVTDSNPYKPSHPRILCTDPTAWTVDWRLLAPRPPDSAFGEDDRDPAGVVKFQNSALTPCDPCGETPDWTGDPSLGQLPANNRLVIYELPTAWARLGEVEAPVQIGVGTFRDVLSLIEAKQPPVHFAGCAALEERAHLKELGTNALELLPPADSFVDREWGYATSNYFAADYDLGFPKGHASPTASTDLANLIKTCHQHEIRFFTDVVMAFATRYSYQNINFLDFHVQANAGDPEEFDQGRKRDGFGGDLFKYNFRLNGYDPVSGQTRELVPARGLMRACLVRWMLDFRIDGIRMDSIPNIANWDFVQEYKDQARQLWRSRAAAAGLSASAADARFLVVGEDLAVPIELLTQNRLDGLWNEEFKRMVRYAIMGQNDEKEPSFERTIRKLIDCRGLGFSDGAQAINYVTSHDVEGFRNERLYNFLNNNDIFETEQRIKLAFVCLLTAVGIPMIFAGEEFADEHDLPVRHPEKQVDPVNFDRLEDPFRKRIFDYVSRLVKFRTAYDALWVNDTEFIHGDFNDGKRVMVWQRGRVSSGKLVVVVANFSEFGTPNPFHPTSEYVVQGWPVMPAGKRWREITQERDIPPEWVGREPIFPWEAKVYALAEL